MIRGPPPLLRSAALLGPFCGVPRALRNRSRASLVLGSPGNGAKAANDAVRRPFWAGFRSLFPYRFGCSFRPTRKRGFFLSVWLALLCTTYVFYLTCSHGASPSGQNQVSVPRCGFLAARWAENSGHLGHLVRQEAINICKIARKSRHRGSPFGPR